MADQFEGFLSYRRADVSVARALHALFTAFGHRIFLDVACIPVGASWEAAITEAASRCRWIVVLWSRNAAASGYMKREWEMIPADCRILPVRLDGSDLPQELAHLHAVEGLGAAKLILARTTELTAGGKMSAADAKAAIIDELRRDGVELTEEQKRAIGAYVSSQRKMMVAGGVATLAWFLTRSAHAAVSMAGVTVVSATGLAFVAGRHTQPDPPVATVHAEANVPAQKPGDVVPASLSSCQDQLLRMREQLDGVNTSLNSCRDEIAACKRDYDQCRNQLQNPRTNVRPSVNAPPSTEPPVTGTGTAATTVVPQPSVAPAPTSTQAKPGAGFGAISHATAVKPVATAFPGTAALAETAAPVTAAPTGTTAPVNTAPPQ